MTTSERRRGRAPGAPERPAMSGEYGIPSDTEGMLSWEWVEQQLTAARSYWVCTTRKDGRPHAMPVWALWFEGELVFSTDPRSVKGRNLARDPRIAVHLESGDDCVILEGMVERFADREALVRFADAYEAKYGFRPDPGSEAHGVYVVRPEVAMAWLEKDFLKTATRWRFA